MIYQRTGGAGKQPSAEIAIFYYCARSGIAYALHDLVARDMGSIYQMHIHTQIGVLLFLSNLKDHSQLGLGLGSYYQ